MGHLKIIKITPSKVFSIVKIKVFASSLVNYKLNIIDLSRQEITLNPCYLVVNKYNA